MNIQKTGSLVIGDDGKRSSVRQESVRVESIDPHASMKSENVLSTTLGRRFRVPQAMQDVLRLTI